MALIKSTLKGLIPVEKSRIQLTDTVLAAATQTLTIDLLLHYLLSITPAAPLTLTLPTAAEVASYFLLSGMRPADGIDFVIRNFGAGGTVTVAVPAGSGTISGSAVVQPTLYRRYVLRLDSLGATPSYTVNDVGTAGSGAIDVVGPASSTDNAVAVFDGVTGKVIKETFAADPLRAVSDADDNVLLGTGTAFASLTNGVDNTVLGADAAPLLTSGSENVIVGTNAAQVLTTGVRNIVVGIGALKLSTGDDNTIVGWRTGFASLETGDENVMVGGDSDVAAAATSRGTAVGVQSIAGTSGVAIGELARTGTGSEIAIGGQARSGTGCITMGFSAGNFVGTESIAIGVNALDDDTAGKVANIAIGNTALTALTTGDNNVVVGHTAGAAMTTAGQNVLVGHRAGESILGGGDNIIIGQLSAATLTTGTDNVLIGRAADVSGATATNEITIGAGAVGVGNNTCVVTNIRAVAGANNAVGVTAADQLVDTTASARKWKDNIQPLESSGAIIDSLKPVSFEWNNKTATPGVADLGLIAEEVLEAYPAMGNRDKDGEAHGVKYDWLHILLLKELQDLRKRVSGQGNELQDLQKRVSEVEKIAF